MSEPLSNKPKITRKDILTGYVMRYFAQNISTKKITEIDEIQYNTIIKNPQYETLSLKWVITGYATTIVNTDGTITTGASDQNFVTTNWYDKQMPGLYRMLRNSLEFFQGVDKQ